MNTVILLLPCQCRHAPCKGADALHALPGAAQAVQALYLSTLPVGVSFVTSGKSFSLTSADVLSTTFNAAIASFGNASSGGSAPATAPAAASGAAAGGRRLLQAAAAAAPAPAVRTRHVFF